ncbi:MAG: hypothetical protein J6C05_08875 [Prevotella sp.]|nr:hypothetical protein [Prevotella sp.]MBO5157221.1 hypothetical protein [Prevotella sp.]
MQEKEKDFTAVGLMSYYKELPQKDKNNLRMYVAMQFNLNYMTVDNKFKGRTKFSAAELLALQPIINNELWKK